MILVTGGTGFIGRKLVTALAARGRPVCVLARTPSACADFPPAVTVRRADLLDPGTVHRAVDGVTSIVHLAAALEGAGDPVTMFRINVEGTRAIASAARSHGVRTFVHCSSAGVYGSGASPVPHAETATPRPSSPYERSKLEAERALIDALQGSTVRWTILRPSGVHGPGRIATLNFYRAVEQRKLWIHGPARTIVHPTYVDDVLEGIQLVLDRTGTDTGIFNIAGERPIDYRDLIDMIARAMQRRAVQIRPVPSLFRASAVALDRAMTAIGLTPSPLVKRLEQSIVNRAVDISKATRELGFEPVSLEAGIRQTAQWVSALRASAEDRHSGAR